MWLILRQKVAPLYWRSDTHTHIHFGATLYAQHYESASTALLCLQHDLERAKPPRPAAGILLPPPPLRCQRWTERSIPHHPSPCPFTQRHPPPAASSTEDPSRKLPTATRPDVNILSGLLCCKLLLAEPDIATSCNGSPPPPSCLPIILAVVLP